MLAYILIVVIAYGIAYWITSTGPNLWRSIIGFSLSFFVAWFGGSTLAAILIAWMKLGDASSILLSGRSFWWAFFGASVGVYNARYKLRKGEAAPPLSVPKWAGKIALGICIVGILVAVGLPAYQDYKKRSDITSSSSSKTPEEYGFGIKSRTEYEGTVVKYRKKINSGEIHVFDSTPTMYLKEEDKEWPKEEVQKIGFLWWYENNYVYMVISNNHPRIAIRKIILGANHGSCGTIGQTSYPVDLNVDIQPAHFAVVRLSNDSLFKFAYQISGKLNDEEQKRWSTDRTDRNDCFNILNAWFSDF